MNYSSIYGTIFFESLYNAEKLPATFFNEIISNVRSNFEIKKDLFFKFESLFGDISEARLIFEKLLSLVNN